MKIVFACLLACVVSAGFRSAKHDGNGFVPVHASDTTAPGDKLYAGDAKLVQLSAQFSFTEGPTVDKQGNIYFTDQPNDKIWKYGTDGNLSVFMDKTGRSNGMYFDRKGNLLSCADEKDEIWSISPDKKVKVLVKGFRGHRLNGPNDLWIDAKGGIYFTDPYYQRSYWDRTASDLDGEKVYYLPAGKGEPVIVDSTLAKPNGIVGTPDGKYLYVADIKGNKTYRYEIGKDGSLKERKLFISQGSDGITLDSRGNLYLCGNGVTIYSSAGEKIDHINVPAKWTANLCFGGKTRTDLFITASEAVYMFPMLVKGVE